MAWRQRTTELLADYLRFVGRGAFLANGILLALASLWFVTKFLWHLMQFLDRTLFSKPW